jgi:hypothetical protein
MSRYHDEVSELNDLNLSDAEIDLIDGMESVAEDWPEEYGDAFFSLIYKITVGSSF